MNDDDIKSWISKLEPVAYGASINPKPDQHPTDGYRQPLPPTPPASRNKRQAMMADSQRTPPTKRQKVRDEGGDDDDAEETPRVTGRGGPRPHPIGSPRTSLLAASESQSERSQKSSRSSPLKQLAAMEVSGEAIEPRALSLSNPNLPVPLLDLLVELEKCNNGTSVIPGDLEVEIEEKAKQEPRFRTIDPHMFIPANHPKLGPRLSLDHAIHLATEATECLLEEHSEAGWNTMVHHPLLFRAVFGEERQHQLLGVTDCTDAKIIREYLPTSAQAKMVDFCIYADLKTDTIALEAATHLRQILSDHVINHTNYYPLRQRPIMISIETKKPHAASTATAELQISTWHAAQWKLLEKLIEESGGSFDGLPFLPGIIVEGHNWIFIATTREGRKTVLWKEQMFGSTSNFLGVFKTVWGLQRLAKWASDVYWPWFRKNALGVPEG